MNINIIANVLIRITFIIWAVAITVLSVIAYQDKDIIVQDDLVSSSRIEIHLIAFLIGAL